MVTPNASANAKLGIYFAHAILALGVIILLLGLKLYGPSSLMYLEGLAFSFYGLVASFLEALLLLVEKRPWFNRYIDFRNAFLYELHMVLLAATHIIVYKFFSELADGRSHIPDDHDALDETAHGWGGVDTYFIIGDFMNCFGITVRAKDAVGEHYVNHTVCAQDLDHADQLIIQYYQKSDEILIELDQAVQLDDIHAEGDPRILETQGKIYFDKRI